MPISFSQPASRFLPSPNRRSSQAANNKPAMNAAIQFGEIYGILGKPPKTSPNQKPQPFPYQVQDPEVDAVYNQMKAEATANGLAMDDLIITRKGVMVNGQPVGRELRLVFTDGDAEYLKEKKPALLSNLETIEQLQKKRDDVQLTLKDLNEKRQGWSYGLYSWFGSMATSQATQFATWDEEYKTAIKTLKKIDLFAQNADTLYQRDTKPTLKKIKKAIEGYIQLDHLKSLLAEKEFDLKTGSDLSLPPYAYWWHKTD
jgi:hypothetical protein